MLVLLPVQALLVGLRDAFEPLRMLVVAAAVTVAVNRAVGTLSVPCWHWSFVRALDDHEAAGLVMLIGLLVQKLPPDAADGQTHRDCPFDSLRAAVTR
jgi:hypothetical protein